MFVGDSVQAACLCGIPIIPLKGLSALAGLAELNGQRRTSVLHIRSEGGHGTRVDGDRTGNLPDAPKTVFRLQRQGERLGFIRGVFVHMDRIGHVRIWFKVTKGPVVVERPVDHRCHHGKRRACLALVQGHVEDGLGFDVDCPGSHIVATVVCKRLKLNHLGFHESRHIGQNVGGFCAVVGASVFKGPFVGDRALTRVGQGWGKRRAQAIHDLKRCVRTGQRGHRPCFLGDAVVVIDNPRRGLEHHLQGWVANVRVGYSEACVTAAVSKLPCHRPVCHGGKVHGHRRTAFIHVAGQGQFWRGQHVNGLSHRCTAMGIADVQSHAVGAGRIE